MGPLENASVISSGLEDESGGVGVGHGGDDESIDDGGGGRNDCNSMAKTIVSTLGNGKQQSKHATLSTAAHKAQSNAQLTTHSGTSGGTRGDRSSSDHGSSNATYACENDDGGDAASSPFNERDGDGGRSQRRALGSVHPFPSSTNGHNAATAGLYGGGCVLLRLNFRGAEVAVFLKRLIADFAGVPVGKSWSALKAAAAHLGIQIHQP
jgi:hypothetical protein